jgi:RNA 2',3'-cyclic 3'-phosphodiesterase
VRVSSSAAVRRLFFALWPDDRLRDALLSVIQPLFATPGGRAVPAGNLHVTLAFLGGVAPDQIPPALAVASARAWPEADLVFDRLAWWPRARLLCLEASSLPPDFAAAVQVFHEDLRLSGFRVERRPFRAHITLARNVSHPPGGGVGDQTISPFVWPVKGVALVASTPTPEGSLYRVLEPR